MRTLVIFAKEPIPGQVKTRLAAAIGARAACRLYRAFLSDLASTVAAAQGLRVEWWVEGDPRAFAAIIRRTMRGTSGPAADFFCQPGGDLGRRMGQAFADAFGRQGQPVTLIGSDCPLVGLPHLENLFCAVEAGADAALLPVADGGYFGLALAGPAPEAFLGIPWSTASVLGDTLRAMRAAGRKVRVLPPLYDVDTGADLARLANDLRTDPGAAPETARLLAELTPRQSAAARP